MMELNVDFSSGYSVFLLLLLAAGIYIVLYLFRIFIPLVFSGKINHNRFRKFYTIAEGLVWGLYLIAAAVFFLKHNIVLSAILFMVFLLLFYWYARFAVRDYIAGLVFKSENRFTPGEIIEIEGHKGEIKQFHARSIEIEDDTGRRIHLPYTLLMGIVSSPQRISETVLSFSFEYRVPSSQQFDNIKTLLRQFIFTLPWTVLKNEPKIQLLEESDNYYLVKITFYTFDESYFQPVQKRIEDYIDKSF